MLRSAAAPRARALSNLARREFDNSFRLRGVMLVILEPRQAFVHSSVRRIADRRGTGVRNVLAVDFAARRPLRKSP
jgi:hypothetical protein